MASGGETPPERDVKVLYDPLIKQNSRSNPIDVVRKN
jgi:hypothetical protein